MFEKNLISFSPSVILRYDEKYIESADISAEELKVFIDSHADHFKNRMSRLLSKNNEKARNPEKRVAAPILIARLALGGYEKKAFKNEFPVFGRVCTNPDELNDATRPYWESIEETIFTPEVHRRIGVNIAEGTAGTWLAIRAPRESS